MRSAFRRYLAEQSRAVVMANSAIVVFDCRLSLRERTSFRGAKGDNRLNVSKCGINQMMTSATQSDLSQKISELRFCIAELQRRQQTDRWRAWLWLLKENAARQMLAMMQQSATESDAVELTAEEQAELMAHHSLLLDPRDASPAIAPQWRVELQAHVRQTLEKYFAERRRTL